MCWRSSPTGSRTWPSTLKENIALGRTVRFEAPQGAIIGSYLHLQNGRGVNAVLVEVTGADDALAHEIALHIAFARPEYLRREDVPAEQVEDFRQTAAAIARNEGKPEAAMDKILEGRLNGWYKERVLLDQPFVRDESQTIAQVLGRREGAQVRSSRRRLVSGSERRLVTEVVPDRERARPRWHRVVLKLSGEALASSLSDETIDASTVARLAREISAARTELDIQIAIVVGGGNIWRGTTGAGQGMDRATSDIMGMLGTVINALALQDALERVGCPTRVLSAIHMAEVCEPYIRRRAIVTWKRAA